MPAVIGREARKGRLRAYTADGHDGKVWLSDDFVYASEKVGEEARGRGAARRHGPVLVSATAPGGGDQYVNAADPGQRPLVRRHAAPHVAARRAVLTLCRVRPRLRLRAPRTRSRVCDSVYDRRMRSRGVYFRSRLPACPYNLRFKEQTIFSLTPSY